MILLHPHHLLRNYPDERSAEVMRKTVEFFESKGLQRIKADDQAAVWYQDFVDFLSRERIFATMCTPSEYGGDDTRWDTWRNSEFGEILGFYGLPYWYVWQVTVLGLGPIWMSDNEAVKERTAALLDDGAIFAFGLSEKEHGADLYSTDMTLTRTSEGEYVANGSKYYIGNGNDAAIVSTFAKTNDTGEYCFFATDSQHPSYRLVKNVMHSQNFVAEYALDDYPVTDSDILSRGEAAWNAALNTVNIGKYNLGWGSIGMCTHAFYEAIPTRCPPPPLRHDGDRLPPRQASVHRRLRASRGDEARGVASRRLHAFCHTRRPPLPALQPGREDEGDDAG